MDPFSYVCILTSMLGLLYSGSMLLFIILCSVAAFTKSERYHSAFAVFYFVYNGAMLGSNLLRLI
jgi:hypothetical protein